MKPERSGLIGITGFIVTSEGKASGSLAKILNKLTLKFELKAGEEGKLFGSVTSQMISDELANQKLEVNKREIVLDDPIKELGSHKVSVELGEGITASIKVKVSADSD